MKLIKILPTIFIICIFSALSADTWTEASITENTTWTRNNGSGDGIWIIDVAGDELRIEAGVTLTIEPGVQVKFEDDARMLVDGTLIAQGTETDSIIFTVNTEAGSPTEWGGIKLLAESENHRIEYCRIEFADADLTGAWAPFYGIHGGGIFVDDSISTVEIRHNLIWKNRAVEAGAGIYLRGNSPALVENNVIRNNRAGNYGGGLGTRGLADGIQSIPVIQNNLILENDADDVGGGGIGLFANSEAIISNNLIYGNNSLNGAGGGIISVLGSSAATVQNNVIWANTADSDDQVSGSVNITYSDIQGGFSGTGNIDLDPEFIDEANEDFHFEATSPLVDGGNNTDAPTADFEGTARPFDGDRNDVATVDMGPYEYVNTPPVLTSTPVTEANEDELYTYQVTADDPDAAESLTFSLLLAPEFLSIDPETGEISGTPLTDDDAGPHDVTVEVADLNDATDTQDYVLNVTSVNDTPVVSDISGQEIEEGGSFQTINLDQYVEDEETADADISWSYSGNTELSVEISTNNIATISAPDENWFGSETITFTASDTEGLSDSDEAVFTVTNVNDQPVVGNIPGESIPEGSSFATINLDDYVEDVDNADQELTWSVSGDVQLSVTIDENRVATIVPLDEDWNGTETITFTATDPGGLSDSDTAHFTISPVNDAPVVSNIEDQTIEEGETFLAIILDDYVDDVDNTDEEISWTYSGNSELVVTIASNRIATVSTPDEDWFGSETITFTATDPGGLSGSDDAVFTVTNINDAPVVSGIPGETVAEGGSFATIALDDFIDDIDNDDSEITWTSEGEANLQVTIDDNRIATVVALDEDWNGTEIITFRGTDPGGLSDSDTATFTVTPVNDAPVVSGIQDQTIEEGQSFSTVDLNNYVSDVDNEPSEMDWSYSGNTELTVDIDQNNIATISIPTSDWFGSETITFTATDPGGLSGSDDAVFTVTNINDAPVVSGIPGETVAEGGSFATIALDDFIDDIDNDDSEITWTSEGEANLQVTIDDNRIATITALDEDWNGTEIITFRGTDPGGLSDSDTAAFTVTPVNDAPVVSGIQDQTIEEGQSFSTIDLNTFVNDVDNLDSEMDWTYSGNSELIVTIDENAVATVSVPDENWLGSETITFTATDPAGLSDSDDAVFTVNNVNDAPVVLDIPGETVDEGAPFSTITLDNFVEDVDNTVEEMTWTVEGEEYLSVSIDENRIATVSPLDENWNGSEILTFRATDPGGLSSTDTVEFTVTPVNDAPVVSGIEDQTVDEGMEFAEFDLDDFVEDVDNSDAEMTWEYNGNTELSITIDENNVVTVAAPADDWFGLETVVFTAEDPEGLSDSDTVVFEIASINDAPVVSGIPGEEVEEGQMFASIDLDLFVSDVDNAIEDMTWSVTGNQDLTVSIDTNRTAFISTPDSNWYGSEELIFTATDPGGLADSDTVTFTATNINDAPAIDAFIVLPVQEGENFDPIELDLFVEDVDNADEELVWTVKGTNELMIEIDENRLAMVSIPDENWFGSETVLFHVMDPDGLEDSTAVELTVVEVNDAPLFTSELPQLAFAEDDSLDYDPGNWLDYAEDADHPDSLLSFSILSANYLEVNLVEGTFRFNAPENWFGTDTLELEVSDGELADTSKFMVRVLSVNDAPVLSGIPDSVVFFNDTAERLSMYDFVEDVDHADSTLSWTFESSSDSVLTEFSAQSGELEISAPGFAGSASISIKVMDDSSAFAMDTLMVVVERVTALEDDIFSGIPKNFDLHQNFPNPFNPVTTIRYAMPKAGDVLLEVYNVLGQKVATLVNESKMAGYHVVQFDAGSMASGVYFYSISSGSYYKVRKMIIMK